MEKINFIKIMKILSSSYNKDFTSDDLQIWFLQFKNEDFENTYKAVNNLIRKSKFMPSIADILHEIKLLENPDLLLNSDEEFDNVRKAIRRYGSYRTKELMESLKPKTAEVVRRIGLQRICECEQDKIKFIKNEFQEIFENIQNIDYEQKLLGNFGAEIGKRLLIEENTD